MPIPLVAIAPALWEAVLAVVAWLGRRKLWEWGAMALGGEATRQFAFSDEEWSDFQLRINRVIVALARNHLGLELSEEAPLSDGSLAAAISLVVGFRLRSVRDRQMILEDLSQVAAHAIHEKTGIVLRDPLNKQTTIEDMETFAADRVSEKIGLRITNFRDPEQVKRDVFSFAIAEFGRRYGVPIEDASSPAAVIESLKEWARREAVARVATDLTAALAAKGADGVALGVKLQMATATKDKPAGATPVEIMQAAQLSLANHLNSLAEKSKETPASVRRREQNRQAQRRFRGAKKPDSPYFIPERVGGRSYYVPVGKSISFADGGADIDPAVRGKPEEKPIDPPGSDNGWLKSEKTGVRLAPDAAGGSGAGGGAAAAQRPTWLRVPPPALKPKPVPAPARPKGL